MKLNIPYDGKTVVEAVFVYFTVNLLYFEVTEKNHDKSQRRNTITGLLTELGSSRLQLHRFSTRTVRYIISKIS
jgi:hypothetical protein